MTTFTWLCAFLSIIGVILNIKKHRSCFIIWAVTNASWTVVDFTVGLYAQSALFFVYFILAIYGLIEWRKRAPN